MMSIKRVVRRSSLPRCIGASAATLSLLFLLALPACAQSASGKFTAQESSSGSSSGLGFAIESEMLTYRAVESNSETIACDLAAYLYHPNLAATFDRSHAGSKCTVKPDPSIRPGIVLLNYDQSVMDSMQVWRADMAIMNALIERANALDKSCAAVGAGVQTLEQGSTAATAIGGMAALTPAGAALTLTEGVLGAFSHQSDASRVIGTVQDQAFMNAVARQLNTFGILVLEPGAYSPYLLAGVDKANSPFLQKASALIAVRDCVARKLATVEPKPSAPPAAGTAVVPPGAGAAVAAQPRTEATDQKAFTEKPITPDDELRKDVVAKMDAFLNGLLGQATPATNKASPTTSGNATATAPTSQPAGLTGILFVDGLAKQLGLGQNGRPAPSRWQHVLMIKALESGGTVTKTTSILGTNLRYNGGSVGTFALFRLDGVLECSGNVFDFGGSIPAKHLEQDLRSYSPDLSTQLVFSRGSCMAQSDAP
jgi:hypothetical protein